jgi:hypothetical protein
VADIRIVTVGDRKKFKVGANVVLKAVAPPGTSDYQWSRNDEVLAGAPTNQYFLTMGTDTAGSYTVRATVHGHVQTSDAVRLAIDGAAGDSGNGDGGPVGDTPPREPVPYRAGFARITAIVVVVLGVALFGVLGYLGSRVLSDTFWPGLEGRLKIAIVLGLPAAVVGLVVLLFGLWMVAVEWRGRLTAAHAAGGNPRGAAIAMVVGAVLLLGTAWVAASAAGTASPGGITTPAATPARTSAPTPSGAGTSTPGPT